MNPSYFRLRQPLTTATARLAAWRGVPGVPELQGSTDLQAVRRAVTPEGTWRLPALFIHERDGWTTFEDLAGSFSARPAADWLRFAGQDEFVFAGYNDAILYGEVIVIRDGQVLREFRYDGGDPATNLDRGRLDFEDEAPLRTWVEAAAFVDDDDLAGADRGLLWIGDLPAAPPTRATGA